MLGKQFYTLPFEEDDDFVFVFSVCEFRQYPRSEKATAPRTVLTDDPQTSAKISS